MKKVLIANRGEIAVRIIRACADEGLQTVAVYSTADSEALHVLYADEAICIGEPSSAKSYLKIPNILSACEITGADAIHPGYGFLSENASFASICRSCLIKFIGPSPEAIALLGDKVQAKIIAQKSKCPVIPGSDGVVRDDREALAVAERVGFPVLIKAVAGGGGKGIREAKTAADFIHHLTAARTEAEASFGCSDVYIEKLIQNPRHVEIQVIGDQHGNYVALGERDCTIQRRRQKLIEESPSPTLTESMRKKLFAASVAILKAAGYYSAGTVEFLVSDGKFYFMEVNTRIQVEHPVTEERSGIDLVREQLRIARGERLSIKQSAVSCSGHVIQLRINAENPKQRFAPSPGLIEHYIVPGGPHVRVDSACYTGYKIPPYYDSMVAKLIVRGENRKEAIMRAQRALKEFYISGIHTTIPFHVFILNHPQFHTAQYDLHWVDDLVEAGENFERTVEEAN